MPSSSRTRGSGRGPDGALRPPVIAPMSERQQLALVMQISSQDAPPAAPSTAEERKRTRQQRNERGETPLHVAAIRGDHDQVKKLLDQGQDPDVPDFAGWTPLHEACIYGWYQVVIVLVKGGANVNAKGLDDDTPLHDATTSGNLKMVKFLVEHGADPFVKNAKAKMPIDYAAPHIYEYLESLKDNNVRASHTGRARDDSSKKVGNASTSSDSSKRNMDCLAQEHFDNKDSAAQDKGSGDNKDEGNQLSSGVVSSSQDEVAAGPKRPFTDEGHEAESVEDDISKRKKRKENEEKEPMAKPAPVARSGPGRILTGTKPPGPASKTGATPLGKGANVQGGGKGGTAGSSTGKGGQQAQGKGGSVAGKLGTQNQGKTSGSAKGTTSMVPSKQERKSPVASPKPNQAKDADGDSEDQKNQESTAPKVPPLKIVIPGGAGGSANRNEQEGEGGTGQRGSGKGRGSVATLPYVLPCTSAADAGQTSDSSDGNSDDKRPGEGGKGQDSEHAPSTSSGGVSGRSETVNNPGPSVELHPRKRKIKASKDSHSREPVKTEPTPDSTVSHNVTHSNPYQMYIHIRKQIENRQKSLFPVKPKPPKDFNKYLMNRCTYTLQSNVNPEPQVEIPHNMPPQMVSEFTDQEKERTRMRIQHLVEKEKLVLAVEQEILRVHGRAERAVINQSLPYSVCTMLRDKEVYNVLAPEQEEKRNAQRSRCNSRQINSWLQEVDDKWEKIKEGMLRRQNTEAETLHAVQKMGWEWKLKELGICDYKTTPKIDPTHVPQIFVSNFDLRA
ncbi:ankyrin repeat domain-containing protein 12-like isoform X3 [Cydia splendana]|uniref:ankyrin repeat domain-containing protein 12-like isoform X3 n=1 Tax=Cydia splendana TaxID=1100963 RepID=UPI00212AE106